MIHIEKTNEGYWVADFRGAGPNAAAATYAAPSENDLRELLKGFGASDRDMARVVQQSQRKRDRYDLSSRNHRFLAHTIR
jgi:hypothetical protein